MNIGHFGESMAAAEPVQSGVGRDAVAISIISNSLLLYEGLAALLATRLPLQAMTHYSGDAAAIHPAYPLPNPANHVVLIDGTIGMADTQAWARYWRGRTPAAYVLVLEMHHDIDLIVDCIEAGVGGYTLQGESIDTLVQVIDEVQQGLARCSREVTGRLCARLSGVRQMIGDLAVNIAPLTPRELEVLGYIAQNRSNQEIADLLVIEVRTVKHHVHNILEKLQLTSRHDAALHAAKQGWFATR